MAGETLKPATPGQLREAVRWAAAEEAPLEIRAQGTKRGFGRPLQAKHALDVSALAGIASYEPEELILTAGPATPMAEIEAALAAQGQMLAFEPPDLAPLWGGAAGAGTLGGLLACGLAGPRRVKAGGARDHLLGFAAVSGRGEIFKAGGKVVKNVTGYDLPKLLCGSFGTLAVLSEVTVKALPAAPKSRTVLVFGLDAAAATAAMADAMNAPFDVSGAAFLPAPIAARCGVDLVRDAGASATALRLEGTPGSVAARCAGLRSLLAGRGALEELHTMRSVALWRAIRDLAALLPDAGAALWRISVAPSAGAALAASLGVESFLDWGGGLVWLATRAADADAAAIRTAVARAGGGHATLLRASAAVRAAVPVFEPQAPALAAISARVKDGFDPSRILNPGRMVAGV